MMKVLDIVIENQKTFLYSIGFFPANRAFHEIMWKNMVQFESPYVHRKDILCVPGNSDKNTGTHS
jgi:hypothetical protein